MSICFSGINAKSKSMAITMTPSSRHPLIKLAQIVPWEALSALVKADLQESTLKKTLHLGRKLRLRIHLGVYLLQQMNNLTDRQTEWQLKDNASYQIFCGYGVVDHWHVPDHTKIEEFRSRLTADTQCQIANMAAQLGIKLGYGDSSKMDQDSTVQEAGIAYPSDARLLVKIAGLCQKVYQYFQSQFPEEGETFNIKKIKAAARDYFFSKWTDIEKKKKKFSDLYYGTFLECCKALQLNLANRHIDALPWNIKKAWQQIKLHGKKYFQDVEQYIFTGEKVKDKVMSFHQQQIACFNKKKEGKDLQFGRQFQLGRISGNFIIVAPCKSVRMEDKSSITSMIETHESLFGEGRLESFGTDKGYFSNANLNYLSKTKKVTEICLQKPGQVLSSLTAEQMADYEKMTHRRSGIEPLIGHMKNGGQLQRSRMKTDQTALASGYSAVAGFNLRQLIRHQLGKSIAPM